MGIGKINSITDIGEKETIKSNLLIIMGKH